MGTSAKNSGPGQASSLIPSWLEPGGGGSGAGAESEPQPPENPPVEPENPDTPSHSDSEGEPDEKPSDLPQLTPLPPTADSNRFRSARTLFNRSARSGQGGGDRELRKAVGEYVRKGYGGGRNASGRMAESTRAAGNIIGFAQAIRDNGFEAAAKQFGLQGLLGKPIEEASAVLIDTFTGPAITTDENISRDAWCEAVKELIEGGTTNFESLTPDQWAQAVEVFLCKAIELRVFNEIGIEAIGIAPSVAKIDEIENDLAALIRGQVQDTIVPAIQDGQTRSIAELNQYVNGIVDRAFDYLQDLAGEED